MFQSISKGAIEDYFTSNDAIENLLSLFRPKSILQKSPTWRNIYEAEKFSSTQKLRGATKGNQPIWISWEESIPVKSVFVYRLNPKTNAFLELFLYHLSW